MRRWVLGTSIVFLGLVLALWLQRRPPQEQPSEAVSGEDTSFASIPVHAEKPAQALTLTGVVRNAAGTPVVGADVFLAASEQRSLSELNCAICGERLLSCPAPESAQSIAHMLEKHQGELQPALSTRSDAQGRFRFEGLAGISFTVWGWAQGYGPGIKERAAPGDPTELTLPVARTLHGRLVDEEGRGISGVVRVTSRRLAAISEVTSTADGFFEVAGLGEGPFAVSATAEAFLPALARDVEMNDELLTLTLPRPRRLQVRVMAGKALQDATVSLEGNHVSRRLETQGGVLEVGNLYGGTLMVSATSGRLSSLPRPVKLEQPQTSVTLVLDEGGTVAISVVDDSGEPVANPTLELLTWAQERVATKKSRTGDTTVFGPWGAGQYQIRATALGYRTVGVPVKIVPGETGVEITMTRGLTISGRVIDEYGRPTSGVSVLVAPTGDVVYADANGQFVATIPSPGLYQLHAHHSDWGGGDMKVQGPKEGVELQLEPKAQAQVAVTAQGKPVEGASVVLFHSQGNFRSDRVSGPDGVVLMRGLPEDAYTLVATHPDYLPSERQPLPLKDGELRRATAELKVGGKIEGQVVDTLGLPIGGVTVAVTPRGAEPAPVDTQGRFVLSPLRPAVTYRLHVVQKGFEPVDKVSAKPGGAPVRLVLKRQPIFRGRVLGEGQPLKNFRVDEQPVTSPDGRFELPLPATEDRVIVSIDALGFEPQVVDRPNVPDLGDIELTRAPVVTGVVREEGGAPVADAVVSCDMCEQSVLSGVDGRFSFGKPPFQREFAVVAKKGRRTGTKTVSDDVKAPLEIVIQPGVSVSGVAYLPNGQPAAGVEIAGINVDRGETLSVVTQGDGSYALDVTPGVYRFALNIGPGVAQSEDPLAQIIEISGATRLDFGPVPGRSTVVARVRPQPGYALWLVRGALRTVGNPPMELLRAPWAQLVYQPHTERVVFGALEPGMYTLVWASFHSDVAEGPVVLPVTAPSTREVMMVRE